MKLAAVAIDYDGTIAVDGVFDPGVREAIAQLRLHGIAVVLVTGRRLVELKHVAGNLALLQRDRRGERRGALFPGERPARCHRPRAQFPVPRGPLAAWHRVRRR